MRFTTKEAHAPSGSAGFELLKLHGYVWPTFPLALKIMAALYILYNMF